MHHEILLRVKFSIFTFNLFGLKVTEVRKDYAKLAWTPPESDGGAPIKNYQIEKRDTSKMTWLSAGSVDSHTLDFKVCSVCCIIINAIPRTSSTLKL